MAVKGKPVNRGGQGAVAVAAGGLPSIGIKVHGAYQDISADCLNEPDTFWILLTESFIFYCTLSLIAVIITG
jgi:hypothetical protein